MRPISRFFVPVAFVVALAAPPGSAADRNGALTLEAIFSPDKQLRVEFGGAPLTGLVWSTDGRHYLQPVDGGSTFQPPLSVEVASGRSRPLFDGRRMVEALGKLQDFAVADAKRLLTDEVTLAPDQDAVLVEHSEDLFHYSISAGVARRLTRSPAVEEIPSFSPDGRFVSFVRENDLHVVDVRSGRETALTMDGRTDLLNGKLDWVYQEEIYGRGNFRAHWWSPDSTTLAFLQLDESPVDEFTIVDHLQTRSATEIVHYPKAGAPNPEVRLGVARTSGGKIVWIDTSSYAEIDHLIVRVGWTPDSDQVVLLVQDRTQTWLDINVADPKTGKIQTLVHETSRAFVDSDLTGEPRWLRDGSFLWLSGRNGYHHIYRFAPDGQLRSQLTNGEWEVRQLYGVDEASGWIYFAASEHSPIEVHLYRMRVDGSGFERLSRAPGTHHASIAPDFAHFLDTWSAIDIPPRIYLHRANGDPVRSVDENKVDVLAEFDLPPVEFLQVTARDGFVFEAAIIKPPDFDPASTYPIFQHNYGGPHAQTVRNAWGGSRGMWLRFLAQEGYVVWMCDNRSASAKGIAPTWEAWGQLGIVELEDMETCLSWLTRHPWADETRVAIHGSSYGGFMASFALTHSQAFKVGIASAPVTDWHLYDTIYTERYMQLPQDNPEGYTATSVIEAAGQLHGHLLLTHGTMDDNVHLQNTIQLAHALQQAGKRFELMLYPNSRHGIRDKAQIYHLYRLKTDFLRENL